MSDVYVVYFEFTVDPQYIFGVPVGIVLFLMLNWLITILVNQLWHYRNNVYFSPYDSGWSYFFFFTWPLYLLLVLIKCFVGACAYVWRKV